MRSKACYLSLLFV